MLDDQMVEHVRLTLLVAMKIAAPILAAGILVGIIVSMLQAVTSLQEQTITFVPKIVVMLLVAIVMTPWIVGKLLEFSTQMFTGF
jgi:flagellar biosynthesis protein FliQ